MSDHQPDLTRAEQDAIDIAVAALPARIPTTEHVTVCQEIARDTREWEGVSTIADRYRALEEALLLAGAEALKPLATGELAITAYLKAEAPWLTNAIDLLDEQFRAALWAGRPWVQFRPLLLVGAPGAGKSHLARLMAERTGTGHAVLSMAGMHDASAFEGSPRGFTNTFPSFPAMVITQTRTANPVLVCEELDKADHNERLGDPRAAILTLIEPSTAKTYWDRCLLATCDLSHASWLFTANSTGGLSGPLRSRLDIVEVEGPGEAHFDQLLGNLLRDLASRWRVPQVSLPELSLGAEDALRSRFARSRSVRALARELQAAIAVGVKMATRVVH